MIVDSIKNRPYVRQMIATPGEPDLPVPVPESLHEQTDEELTETDIKRIVADDQAIQTILLGLPEDVYAAVDSCETAKEIWERVRQMMKGSDIGEQEKEAKLFNEWEKFTSTDGESIELYYHRFMQLMNDLKRNKHFSENIASNLKFLNNLQPEWKRHVTIVRQTKNLHEADFTQIYDFLKMNQEEVNELRAKRLAKSHDPLALTAHSQNSFNFPTTHKDQSSSSTHPQKSFPINNKYNPQPPLNKNFMQPPMTSLEDINDPTEAMNAALILFAKAFQLFAPTNNNQRTSSNHRNHQIAQPVMNMGQDRQIQNVGRNGGNQFGQYAVQVAQNQHGFNAWQNGGIQGAQNAGVQSDGNQNGLVVVPGIADQSGTGNVVAARAEGTGIRNQAKCYNYKGLGHIARNCTARLRRNDAAYLQTQLLIAQKEEAGIQLQAEEFDFIAAVGDLDEIEKVNANCILMENLQHASTSGTQHDTAPEEQYTDLLEPIPEPQLVPQNDNHVTSVAPSMVHSGGTVETSSAPNEEIRVFVPQTTKSKEELFLSNVSNMVTVSKTISIPNEDLSDDTTPSVARKFLNEVERLQDQLRDLKGKSSDTPSASNTLDPLNQKFKSKIIELEFQVSVKNTSGTSVTPHVDKPKLSAVTPRSKKLHASTQSHSVPQPNEFNVVRHRNVISLRMFKINPSQTSRVDLVPNKQSSASIRTNLITNSQRHVIVKENISSNMATVSSTGLVHTARTRRPQPKGNTRNARVPSASKSSEVKKSVTVEDHRMTLLLSKNQKTMSSE
nr:hypothetical protein [Tanacetum cinerariifolium]